MRILVIEDDAGIAAGLRTTLQQRGYAVDVCGDVASAWSALRTERFDAVLLDLGLPDADGSVLLQRLRSAPATVGASGAALPNPATPVLIVTARDQVQQRIAGLDMGADDYVAKPFDIDELDARVAVYKANRDVLLNELPKAGFTRLAPSDGAFYLYADVSELTNDSAEFCRRMLAETGVACTPGMDFDPYQGSRTLRFSFAGSTAEMVEAARRLRAWRR